MTGLVVLHAVVGLAVVGFGARLGRRSLALGALPSAATLVWLATRLDRVLDGRPVTEHTSWVGGLGLGVDFRLDGFGALMAALVAGIGLLVFAYSARYFDPADVDLGRLAGLITLFAGAMLGLVLADHLLLLYTFWELTSVTSFLLIGIDHSRPQSRAAALQALLVTGAGGLAMLGGFVLIGQAAGTYRLGALLADPPSGTTVTVGLVLVAIGALTKSAQYPFHGWLPAAMVAPTPVSAYLHSATMVKAGVYLAARFAPAFAAVTAGWRPILLGAGLVTMVGGGLRALRQCDLKLLLAFGTVSQLGFMMVLFGAGTDAATAAGCDVLVAHALFKAALFMAVGVLDRQTGTRDLRHLPALGPGWTAVKATVVLSAASMAGIPLVFGFVAKEEAYSGLAEGGYAYDTLVLAGVVGASVLTVAYSARFVWGALFAGSRRSPAADGSTPPAPALAFVAPAAVLAVLSLLLGLVPPSANRWVGAAVRSLDPDAAPVDLALWHGLEPALWLSILTVAAGALLFLARGSVERALRLGHRLPSGSDGYLIALRGLNGLAGRVTGAVQNGSLPFYAGVILSTAAFLPGWVLLTEGDWPGWPQLVDVPAQVPAVLVVATGALAASITRHRFSAALFLGVTGYAMAALFVIQGAPDLALTQAAIETLSTVLFVLALRRLPDRFERHSTRLTRATRILVAAGVGLTVFAFALMAGAGRTAEPVSEEMVDRALPDGEGRNVVNVILVDFRGLDTMGEIAVLTVASIGAVALARAGRRPHREGPAP
jgi:multicomponent Na+:H+ antiporter subunit A